VRPPFVWWGKRIPRAATHDLVRTARCRRSKKIDFYGSQIFLVHRLPTTPTIPATAIPATAIPTAAVPAAAAPTGPAPTAAAPTAAATARRRRRRNPDLTAAAAAAPAAAPTPTGAAPATLRRRISGNRRNTECDSRCEHDGNPAQPEQHEHLPRSCLNLPPRALAYDLGRQTTQETRRSSDIRSIVQVSHF